MKVACISYPMLFQRSGGLQNQIRSTIDALRRLSVDVSLVDPTRERLGAFDIVHVFAAINGNHRVVQEAKAQRVKVALSPLLQPQAEPWDRLRFRLCSEFTARVSGYRLKTTYDDVRSAVDGADSILAQSALERLALCRLFGDHLSPRIRVIPNGIGDTFFQATAQLFMDHFGPHDPFVLVAGSVSSYKNQLGVIEATADDGCQIVLVGPVADQPYLDKCLAAGRGRVSYLGCLDYLDARLAACYAAASVTVLTSKGETCGLPVLESLAAGTPAVITRNTGLDIPPAPPLLQYVSADDPRDVRRAIRLAMASGRDRERCRNLVVNFTWHHVAQLTARAYRDLLVGQTVGDSEQPPGFGEGRIHQAGHGD